MEPVQEAMDQRREEDTRAPEQDDAAVERIEGLEPLAVRARDRIHRTHAAENHRGVDERIEPAKLAQEVIAGDAHRQRAHEQRAGQDSGTDHAVRDLASRKRVLPRLSLVPPRNDLHGTSTTFPNCCRAPMRACAARASASGRTESTTE